MSNARRQNRRAGSGESNGSDNSGRKIGDDVVHTHRAADLAPTPQEQEATTIMMATPPSTRPGWEDGGEFRDMDEIDASVSLDPKHPKHANAVTTKTTCEGQHNANSCREFKTTTTKSKEEVAPTEKRSSTTTSKLGSSCDIGKKKEGAPKINAKKRRGRKNKTALALLAMVEQEKNETTDTSSNAKASTKTEASTKTGAYTKSKASTKKEAATKTEVMHSSNENEKNGICNNLASSTDGTKQVRKGKHKRKGKSSALALALAEQCHISPPP